MLIPVFKTVALAIQFNKPIVPPAQMAYIYTKKICNVSITALTGTTTIAIQTSVTSVRITVLHAKSLITLISPAPNAKTGTGWTKLPIKHVLYVHKDVTSANIQTI